MDFITAVKTGFAKFATFQGRARRSEYWFFFLFLILGNVVFTVLDIATEIGVLALIFALITLIPGLAVTARRRHDTGRSGWWYLLYFVPIVGAIVLIVWFCTKGTEGENRFGADPVETAVPV